MTIRHPLSMLSFALTVALAGLHCGGTTIVRSSTDGGPLPPEPADSCTPRVPATHRASPSACPTNGPLGVTGGTCTASSQCTSGSGGACKFGRATSGSCAYDECASDANCGAGALCVCASPSACLPADCRIDSDCGSGGYCSPSVGTCGPGYGTVGYYCHKPCADECVDDADCAGVDAGFRGTPYCAWDPTRAQWACSSSFCSG